MTELWASAWAASGGEIAPQAEEAEAGGVDGLFITDSQNLWMDCWVAVTAVAQATSRLKLGIAVTNPITRHPAVTAGAAASVQDLSHGRFRLGIGRGNSAANLLGYAPARVEFFRGYVSRLQAYLRGEEVPFGLGGPEAGGELPDVSTFGFGQTPKGSRISWLPGVQAKVPVEVSAAGPKLIRVAAELGDGVVLSLGADVERIAGLLAQVDEARSAVGLADAPFARHANLHVIPHRDRSVARRLAAGLVGGTAMLQAGAASLDAETRRKAAKLRGAYDITRKGTSQAVLAPDEMVDQFAIAGTPEYCVERLRALADLGFDRLSFPLRVRGASPREQGEVKELALREVVPGFRG